MSWDREGGKKGKKKGEGDEAALQAHDYGYFYNFVTSQCFKLDDHEVDVVEEEIVLEDDRDQAYMLHYIPRGLEEYNLCYQEDKSLCSSPKDTPLARTLTFALKISAPAAAETLPVASEKDDSK